MIHPVYLASTSPRRAELLRQIGVPFSVVRVDIDESWQTGESLLDYVQRLATQKANAAAAGLPAGAVVLAADTAGVCDELRLIKPRDEAHARAMWMTMSGRSHTVATAVSVCRDGQVETAVVSSEVWFRKLNDEDCRRYWATGEPQDKAGGYAIQGLGSVFVERLAGSYSGVVGLPVCETAALLARFGVPCWQPLHDAG